jgi:hypothetical protein
MQIAIWRIGVLAHFAQAEVRIEGIALVVDSSLSLSPRDKSSKLAGLALSAGHA